MAAPGAGNQIARRVIDDLVDFSGETTVLKYMKFFVGQQIAEGHKALEDLGEVYDMLICLRDDRHGENTKLIGLNELITQAEEEIQAKEVHVEMMEAASNSG
ncbi:hypothetical protein Tco_1364228 [Tanacetum coccineum]